MKAAIYGRVSTGEQVVDNQLIELRRYVTARGWEAVRRWRRFGESLYIGQLARFTSAL
jgi:DNA invertase Pin-like site-specific DNA recombinase